jgi:hypothetical protein
MRTLVLSDGFSASAAPTAGGQAAIGIAVAADDATYASTYGAPTNGSVYLNTSTGSVRCYLSAAWFDLLTASSAVQVTNKDIDGGAATNSRRITVPKATLSALNALTRKAGTIMYASDSGKFLGDNGSLLSSLGGSGGGSSLLWRLLGNAPTENDITNLEVLDFDYLSSQEIWAALQVPTDYSVGSQIKLAGGAFVTSVTSGNVLFKATTYLYRAGSTVVNGALPAINRNSTNAVVAAAGVANTLTSIGDVDLTDASGLIGATAIAAGDWLGVKLIRDIANEGTSAAADARFMRYFMAPKIG